MKSRARSLDRGLIRISPADCRGSRPLLPPPATPPTPTTPTPHAWTIAEAIAIHGPIGIGASIGVDRSVGGIAVSTIPVTIPPAGRSWLGVYYQKRRRD